MDRFDEVGRGAMIQAVPVLSKLSEDVPRGVRIGTAPIPDRWENLIDWFINSHEIFTALHEQDLGRRQLIADIGHRELSTALFIHGLFFVSEYKSDWAKRLEVLLDHFGFTGGTVYPRAISIAKHINPYWNATVLVEEIHKFRRETWGDKEFPEIRTYDMRHWLAELDSYHATLAPLVAAEKAVSEELADSEMPPLEIPSDVLIAVQTSLEILKAISATSGGREFSFECKPTDLRAALLLAALDEVDPERGQMSALQQKLGISYLTLRHTIDQYFEGTSIQDTEEQLGVLRALGKSKDVLPDYARLAELSTVIEATLRSKQRTSGSPRRSGASSPSGEISAFASGENTEELKKLSVPDQLRSRVLQSLSILEKLARQPAGSAAAFHLDCTAQELRTALFVRAAQNVEAVRGAFGKLAESLGLGSMAIQKRLAALGDETGLTDRSIIYSHVRASLIGHPRHGELAELLKTADLAEVIKTASTRTVRVRAYRDIDMSDQPPTEDRASYSGLDIYKRQALVDNPMEKEEEVRLHGLMKAGDADAREKLIKANLRLVVKIAKEYVPLLPFQDLISEGNIGLMKAVDKFDPSFGAKVSTYASWWIHQGIKRAIANQSKDVRVPVHMADNGRKLIKMRQKIEQETGESPSIEDLAAALEWSVEKTTKVAEIGIAKLSSLDAEVSDEQGAATFGELFQDEHAEGADVQASRSNMGEVIKELVKQPGLLDEREKHILDLRFGLIDGESLTLEDIGEMFDVTRERIRQIQTIALLKLKKAILSRDRGNGI